MVTIEFWKIYSFWVLFLFVLWCLGALPFSPFASAIVSLLGTLYVFPGALTPAYTLILVTHIIPVLVLRNTPLDLIPNVCVFILYSLVLALNGTHPVAVYREIARTFPKSIGAYLRQRDLL